MTTLSARLIAARKIAGLSQSEAARVAGVSRATVQNAEAGRYEMPTLGTLTRLARVYRIEVNALLAAHGGDRSDQPEASPETDRAPIPTAATR